MGIWRPISGLILPWMRVAAPWRFLPCPSCCDTFDCWCAACEGTGGDNAPCCWKVELTGLADTVDCWLCHCLHEPFYIDMGADAYPSGDNCSATESTLVFGPLCASNYTATLTLADEGDGTYTITLVVSNTESTFTFKKTYNDKIACTELSEEVIPLDSQSGDCDASGASAKLTAIADGVSCSNTARSPTCCSCDTPDIPQVTATISGVANISDYPTCPDLYDTLIASGCSESNARLYLAISCCGCDDCTDINGTYTLTRVGDTLVWWTAVRDADTDCCAPAYPSGTACEGPDINLKVEVLTADDGSGCYVRAVLYEPGGTSTEESYTIAEWTSAVSQPDTCESLLDGASLSVESRTSDVSGNCDVYYDCTNPATSEAYSGRLYDGCDYSSINTTMNISL